MRRLLHVVWFKRDLRLHDHYPIVAANRAGSILPLYIIQPEIIHAEDFDARHWQFIRGCLRELQQKLAALGTNLIVRVGHAVEVLHHIHCRYGIAALYSHRETGNLASYAIDTAVSQWAHQHHIPWHQYNQSGVIRKLRSRDGWAARWQKCMEKTPAQPPERLLHPPHPLPPEKIPTAEELHIRALGAHQLQQPGETAAWHTLQTFLQWRGAQYHRALSSPVTAWEGCSRLSPHLSWGTISLRCVVQAARQRQQQLRAQYANGAPPTYRLTALSTFLSRLHWRSHFMQKLEDFPHMEIQNLWSAADGLRPLQPEEQLLQAWCEGQTGYPFLDACLRAVRATGWMNFRMRAMMMSFAAYDLWLHWRQPGLYLARCFLDYEPGIHWPQVQMQSGTTGINSLRIYDPVKQGLQHDPTGEFTRRWVPELARVPLPYLHQPWLMTPLQQRHCQVILGKHYPHRIVDHTQVARLAKERFAPLRRSPHAQALAAAIQEKHGSRKSDLPQGVHLATRRKSLLKNSLQTLFTFTAPPS